MLLIMMLADGTDKIRSGGIDFSGSGSNIGWWLCYNCCRSVIFYFIFFVLIVSIFIIIIIIIIIVSSSCSSSIVIVIIYTTIVVYTRFMFQYYPFMYISKGGPPYKVSGTMSEVLDILAKNLDFW